MVKKSENLKKSRKISKNHFFSKNLKILKIFFFRRKKNKKNAIILVLPNEEIILRPELSSPPRFRIQGGYPERYGRTKDGGRTEILVSNPILERRSTVLLLLLCTYVTLRLPPQDSEMGWTGELWSKTNLLDWQN